MVKVGILGMRKRCPGKNVIAPQLFRTEQLITAQLRSNSDFTEIETTIYMVIKLSQYI